MKLYRFLTGPDEGRRFCHKVQSWPCPKGWQLHGSPLSFKCGGTGVMFASGGDQGCWREGLFESRHEAWRQLILTVFLNTALRRNWSPALDLHRRPELFARREGNAARIRSRLERCRLTDPQGPWHSRGWAASMIVASNRTTVLSVRTRWTADHRKSPLWVALESDGKGQSCRHTGIWRFMCGLAASWREQAARGRVVLLFQPCEETGGGAADVTRRPQVDGFGPGFRLALHICRVCR